MNIRLVLRKLGIVAFLLGGSMFFCLPWGLSALGGKPEYENKGLFALVLSMGISFLIGAILRRLGKGAQGTLFRREGIAIVGLSWILAMILGALPYLLSGSHRAVGIPMSICDALFESTSGFSTSGASIMNELENPALLPRCILFWRSMTHFLGGLGIMVLFVAILGQGTAGKTVMRTEMPGPKTASPQSKMQQTAWFLAYVYLGLNAVLIILLLAEGLTLFDSMAYAFGTIATGGFSPHNASVGHYAIDTNLNAPLIEYTLIVFMILGGTNFMLYYWCFLGRPGKLLKNTEWRAFLGIVLFSTLVIWGTGWMNDDFDQYGMSNVRPIPALTGASEHGERVPVPTETEIRFSLFQVVSIITTTGYVTDEFTTWNPCSRGILLLLMFFGSCAGSTAGGVKIIRVVLGVKILGLEIEKFFRPNVVRSLRLDGEPLSDAMRSSILVYFLAYIAVFSLSVLLVLGVESHFSPFDRQITTDHQFMDSISCTLSALNNVGPARGSTENFADFTEFSKFVFTSLMMLGRLEMFVLFSIFSPSFWRKM